ncbi:MAG: dihydrodipicolinate synthase family protein, partial [Gemmatirosa sp.]
MNVRQHLLAGQVIPAHPLALTPARELDERHQRALTRYYVASGAGGIAVGVHTTQFAIHAPQVGLYRPVLELAAETARDALARESGGASRPFVLVAGLVGDTR